MCNVVKSNIKASQLGHDCSSHKGRDVHYRPLFFYPFFETV